MFRGDWQGITGRFDKGLHFSIRCSRRLGQVFQQWQHRPTVLERAEGDFAEDVRVHGDAMIDKRLSEQGIVLAQMIDPDGGVDEKLHRFSRCGPACGAAPAQDRAGCLRGAPDDERFPAQSGRAELHE